MSKDNPLILLVEDELTLQFVFEKQVQKLGYKVGAIADNGLLAIEKVLERQYDLVFMDVRLPGVDGMTAVTRIRAAEKEANKHTKIVGMTAFADRQRCLESGMDDFLQKPVLLEQLKAMIEKWLNFEQLSFNELIPPPIEQFQKTAAELEAIHGRIMSLRKRFGLDSASKNSQ